MALHLAGSHFARKPSLTAADFLRELHARGVLAHPALTSQTETSPTAYANDVQHVLALTYQWLTQEDSGGEAVALLTRAACFAHGEPIPPLLLLQSLHRAAGDVTTAPRSARAALERLVWSGFLHQESRGNVSMHRLLAAAVQQHAPTKDAFLAVAHTVLAAVEACVERRDLAGLAPFQAHLRAIAAGAIGAAATDLARWRYLLKLCDAADAARQTLVDALAREAGQHPGAVSAVLARLLQYSQTHERAGSQRRDHDRARVATLVAQTAFRLEDADLLARVMASRFAIARAEAVRYVYHLWQRRPAIGMQALDALVARMMRATLIGSVLARRPAHEFESCVLLSLLMVVDTERMSGTPEGHASRHHLQRIWQTLIDRARRGVSDRLGSAVLAVAVGVVVRFLRRSTDEDSDRFNATNFAELDYSLRMDRADKASFLRLVECLADDTLDLERAEREMRAATRRGDQLSAFVLGAVFVRHGAAWPGEDDPLPLLDLIERVYEDARSQSPVGPTMPQVTWALLQIQRHRGRWTPRMMRLVERYCDEFVSATQGVWQERARTYATVGLDAVMMGAYELHGEHGDLGELATVQRHLRAGMEARNDRFLLDFLFYAGSLRLETRYWPVLLSNLTPLFGYTSDQVHGALLNLLALMRVRDPHVFEQIVRQRDLPRSLLQEIDLASDTEHVGGDLLWGGHPLLLGACIIGLYYDDQRRADIVRILRYAGQTQSMRDWAISIIKVVGNLAYGQAIFEVGEN